MPSFIRISRDNIRSRTMILIFSVVCFAAAAIDCAIGHDAQVTLVRTETINIKNYTIDLRDKELSRGGAGATASQASIGGNGIVILVYGDNADALQEIADDAFNAAKQENLPILGIILARGPSDINIIEVHSAGALSFIGEDLQSAEPVIKAIRNGAEVVKANVPLSEMFGYVTALRTITSGRATSTMEFSHYAECPKNIADDVIAEAKGVTQA